MVQDPMPPLSILNGKPSLLPGPELLHDLVRLSSASSNVAIDFLEHGSRRQLTYKELHAQTDGLARRIQCTLSKLRHASPVVPIFLPQCPELYIAMIGILKAGKAFCPLNLDTPAERLDFILGDLASQLVITSTACRLDIFDTTDVELLFIDQEPPAQKPELFPEVPHIETTDWAYVLYTSGSTGLPKAVPLSHRAVTQSLLAHERHIPSFSRFLQFAAPTFDVSIFEVFFPLLRGKTLVGCSRSEMLNDLPSVIRLLEVDAVELTPTVVSNMLQGRERLPGLNLLLTIGEMLTKHVVDEFGGTSSRPSILYGMYGPTEAAIHCTLQANFQSTSPVGSIGYPLDTVSAFIMHPASESKPSPDLTILPLGEIGELVVGGYQLADGYLNRPELTASAFIQHSEFGLLYRTGDKARILSNGTLECLGRMVSGQIKLKGQRVELGEIEQAILRTPGCRSTSVLVVDDRLLAFCVVAATEVTSHTIIESCGRWLPPHMVPADITILSAMPQLPSGKVDKEALRIQYLEKRRQIKAAPISDNRSPIEVAIRDVLDRDVSLQTPLANFGLDSLRSIRIASILRKRGYDVAAFDVLSARNLQDLLSICNQKPLLNGFTASGKRNGFKRPSLLVPDFVRTHGEVVDIIPCTPLQLAMLAETISRPRAYCNWIEVEFQGHYSYGYIRDLIERLVQENEILRSGFFANSEAAGTFVQVIWKQLNEGQISNVTSFSKDYTLSSIESMLRPFAVQVNAALQRPRILLQIHHALYDGWSVDLLLRDMDRLFEGKTLDQRSQYREVVNFYTKAPHQPSYQEHASFWADLLEGYHPVRLPNFNGKVVNDSAHRSLCRRSTVNPHVLMSQAQRYMVNPQVFFQGALSRMISYYLGSLDVVIGTVTSGRTIPIAGIEEIYGPCIASLPFRFDFTKCSTIEDMLSRIQKANRDIVQHCILPLRDIGNLCGVRPGTPLFDVLFVWQQSLYSGHTDSNATVVDQVDNLEYKLTVEFQPQDSCIQSKVTYNPGFIPEAQVKNLLHQIDDIVNYLLRDVSAEFTGLSQCFSLPYLSIANPSPEIKHFEHGPAHSVERWASETPDKKALLFGTMTNGSISPFQRLTYRTLNAQANKLAHALAERGAANGELVCVLMEKSPSLYIAILAILKLGCGYLPIVPDSPPERTRRILQDAEVDMCLVDASSSEESRSRLPCAIFDIDSSDISAYPESNIRTVYDGSRLAYAVFTSGSTGSPKGVLVTQDNLMSNLDYLNGLYPTSKSSRLLQACSQAFDVSVFEIFFAWYAGICLCSASKDDLFHNLEGAINVLEVTHLSLTPTVASLINPDNVPNVQFLVTAGEAITEHVRRQWAGRGLYQGLLRGPS